MDENGFRDVDANLEPERPTTVSGKPEGIAWGAILLGFWAVVLIIFSVQNAEQTTVNFLGWSFEIPVALLVMITALVTLVLAGVGSAFYRRRRRKRDMKREASGSDGV